MNDFYSVLQCTHTATSDEIKKNYQRLVKKFHPDKGTQKTEMFLLIDEAYKTLKDIEKRKDYDAALLVNRCNEHCLIYAQLRKEDIELNIDGIAYYPCRCGDQFVIQNEHLVEAECVIECSECSNCIRIK